MIHVTSLTKLRAAANGAQRNQMAMACKERRAFFYESRPSALRYDHAG